jgi:hypothetical protein
VTLGLGARPTRASLGAPRLAVHPHGWASTRGEGRRAHPPTLRQGTARGAGETPRLRHIVNNDRAKPPLRQAIPAGRSTSTASRPRPNGKTLIVAHSVNGQLYTVDPTTGPARPRRRQRGRDRGGRRAAMGGAPHQPGEQDRGGVRPCLRVIQRVSGATCSRPRLPPPASGIAWRWSTPSSTPASRPNPTSTR